MKLECKDCGAEIQRRPRIGPQRKRCPSCRKERQKQNHRDHRDRDPERFRSMATAIKKRWRKEHPDAVREMLKRIKIKTKAHNTMNYAIRVGKLRRGACDVCGSTERIEGHHEDYSKPLNVSWLCKKHHAVLHRKHK